MVVSFNNGLFKSTFCSYLILATCFKLTSSTQGHSAESPLLVSSGDSADSDCNDASHRSLLGRRKRFVLSTRIESVSSLNYGGGGGGGILVYKLTSALR